MSRRTGPGLRRLCQLITALPHIVCQVYGLSGNLSQSLYPGLRSSATDLVGPIDRSLIHTLEGHVFQNVDICKSRPFAPTQENYVTSGTDEWLRAYTLENMHRRYFKRHGLMATIAYDFLGDTNYKCAIGVQHSCAVQCTTVVGHIEDLRVARQVYFAMSSAAHFTSAVEIIHDALVAAQANVGLMAGRMSYTFFWTGPSADEAARARAFKMLMSTTIWAAQSAISSILPMIPWIEVRDWIVHKIADVSDRPALKDIFAQFPPPTETANRRQNDPNIYRYANGRKPAQHFDEPTVNDVMRYIDDTKQIKDGETWQIIDNLVEKDEYKSIGVVSAGRKELANPTLFYDPDLGFVVDKDTRKSSKGKPTSNSYPKGITEGKREFNKWARDKKNEMFDLMVNTRPFEIGVPEKHGGASRLHPNGESLLEWWAGDRYNDRRLHSMGPNLQFHDSETTQGLAGTELPNEANTDSPKRFPDFKERSRMYGIQFAAKHAWSDFKRLCEGSWYNVKRTLHWLRHETPLELLFDNSEMDAIMKERGDNGEYEMSDLGPWTAVDNSGNTGDSAPLGKVRKLSYQSYLREREKREPPTKLKEGERIASWGPVEKSPWRKDGGKSFMEYRMDMLALLNPVLEKDFDKPGKMTLKQVVARANSLFGVFYPSMNSFVISSAVSSMFSNWQANDASRDHNEMSLQFLIQESSSLSRRALKDTVNRIFRSAEVGPNGETEIADLMSIGSFLAADDQALAGWTSSEVESIITKNVLYKALNAALKSQKIYISCTQDLRHIPKKGAEGIPVTDCAQDNTGPQNLKACIHNAVCYMYRWNDRTLIMGHHNEQPFGFEQLGGYPWNLDAPDIIRSSFFSKIYGLEGAELASNLSFAGSGPTADTAANPAFPGVFTIPVCLTPHNWNTQTKDYWIGNDINPWAPVKALPCYCGDLGAETSKVWHEVGFMQSGALDTYVTKNCPRQIKARIEDWLERYVALCRLNIRKSGSQIKKGKDKFCNVVLAELEKRQITSTTELDPEVRHGIKCKVKRKKRGRCAPFYRTPISAAWEEAESLIAARLESEAAAKEAEGMVDGFTETDLRDWETWKEYREGVEEDFLEMAEEPDADNGVEDVL